MMNPSHSRKGVSVAAVSAAFLIFLFTLSTGAPASAQDPAPSVETVGLVNPPSDGVHISVTRLKWRSGSIGVTFRWSPGRPGWR